MLKTTQSLQVYPSGFIGKILPARVHQAQVAYETIPTPLFGVKISLPSQGVRGSEFFDQVYEGLIATPKFTADVELRERIIKEAYSLFQFDSFTQWVNVQSSSPAFSALHRDFLEQTIQSIMLGHTRRRVSIGNWVSLFMRVQDSNIVKEKLIDSTAREGALTHGQAAYSKKVSVPELALSKESLQYLQSPHFTKISHTLVAWFMSLGFEDFVQSMFIIFGDTVIDNQPQ